MIQYFQVKKMEIIVGGIIKKNHKYLLVQESKKDFYGKWNLPSGHLEPDETLLEGAKREIKEETGMDVELINISFIGKDNHALILLFTAQSKDEKESYHTQEILNSKWFSYKEILNIKNELRYPILILNAIHNIENQIHADINIIKKIK